MSITAKTKICMIIGDPVEHSLGPQLYNAVYEKLGINSEYIYIAARVKPEDIQNALNGIRAFGIKSVSVTVPHKTAVMEFLDKIDETAKKIGAVNTIINNDGKLIGYNTDWFGVVHALESITPISGKHIAVLGAGGAARAAVYGLTKQGGKVIIFNRTVKNAKQLAQEFNCKYMSLDNSEEIKTMDIIFNATSVGLHPHVAQTPLAKVYLTDKHIVFDAVYSPYQTQLLKDAKEKGAKVIHGLEMLLYQGTEQFKLTTGHDAPVELMRNILLQHAK
jgi:shikimate dehydrogenase